MKIPYVLKRGEYKHRILSEAVTEAVSNPFLRNELQDVMRHGENITSKRILLRILEDGMNRAETKAYGAETVKDERRWWGQHKTYRDMYYAVSQAKIKMPKPLSLVGFGRKREVKK
ncbi:Uncharacterised protein [Candidatus Norongarragalina meridionalis]|nr:Uncharacterised protein [Candidatus Norongarragalina meridionalis]